MCRILEPDSLDADAQENRRGTERNHARPLEPRASGWRWYPRENTSWGTGLCVVSGVLDVAAVLTQNEALAIAARALRAMVDLIVDAGQHWRS